MYDKLLPCRFCGHEPILIPDYSMAKYICPNCDHTTSIEKWRARNENHNPFIEIKN